MAIKYKMCATFTNQSKNTSTFTNQTKTTVGASLTLDDAPVAIDEMEGTIDNPSNVWKRQAKNTSTFVNQTKN